MAVVAIALNICFMYPVSWIHIWVVMSCKNLYVVYQLTLLCCIIKSLFIDSSQYI